MKNVMTRQATKPAVAEAPKMGPKKKAKPASLPPAPPGSGTELPIIWTMEAAAMHSMKSASPPKARSTHQGTE